MTKKRHTPEQIVTLLRQVEVADGLQPGDTTAIGIAIAGITRDVDSHSHWYKTSGRPTLLAARDAGYRWIGIEDERAFRVLVLEDAVRMVFEHPWYIVVLLRIVNRPVARTRSG